MGKGKKLTYEDVKSYIESQNYKLVDTEFKNVNQKLNMICPKGHKCQICYDKFAGKYQRRCRICDNERKSTIQVKYSVNDIQEYLNQYQFKFLDDEYIGESQKYNLECKNGHKHNVTMKGFKRRTVKCKECENIEKLKERKEFAKNRGYILNTNVYTKYDEKISLTCPKGHTYNTSTWDGFSHGNKCPICDSIHRSENQMLTQTEVSNRISKYGYKLVSEYTGNNKNIKVQCPASHIYDTTLVNFTRGDRCPICSSSYGEQEIYNILLENNVNVIRQYRFNNCKRTYTLPFDFFLPELNTLIEFQGREHYMPVEVFGGEEGYQERIINDKIKKEYAANNNINFIEIKYTEFKEIREILKRNKII